MRLVERELKSDVAEGNLGAFLGGSEVALTSYIICM